MFTGIIQHVGQVRDVREAGAGRRLRIDLGPLADDLDLGQSVAVNGLCLTATELAGTVASFDVVAESLARSTLGELQAGAKVNLERALPATGRLDGHVVQGHVDATAVVDRIEREPGWQTHFQADADLVAQLVPKGSIAIDGVSLTLATVGEGSFSVALIPTTLGETTLSTLKPGRRVNIELDILGKYVRRHIETFLAPGGRADASGVTADLLRRHGFA